MSNKYFRRAEANLKNNFLTEKNDDDNTLNEDTVVQNSKRINKFVFLEAEGNSNNGSDDSDTGSNAKTELKNRNVFDSKIKKSKKQKKKKEKDYEATKNIDVSCDFSKSIAFMKFFKCIYIFRRVFRSEKVTDFVSTRSFNEN